MQQRQFTHPVRHLSKVNMIHASHASCNSSQPTTKRRQQTLHNLETATTIHTSRNLQLHDLLQLRSNRVAVVFVPLATLSNTAMTLTASSVNFLAVLSSSSCVAMLSGLRFPLDLGL